MLMRDSVDLWARAFAGFVHHRVGKTGEVIHPHPVIAVRPSHRILDEQVAHPLELSEEGLGDRWAGVLGVVDGRLAELVLGLRMKPTAHPIRARTRASASSPGTIFALPDRTSSRRRAASTSHAA